jgi:MoxR-like ATPase
MGEDRRAAEKPAGGDDGLNWQAQQGLRHPRLGGADRLCAGAGGGLAPERHVCRRPQSARGIALLQAARAWAALEGRDHVLPEDVQAVLVPVCAHRLRPLKSAHVALASRDLVLQLQASVPV